MKAKPARLIFWSLSISSFASLALAQDTPPSAAPASATPSAAAALAASPETHLAQTVQLTVPKGAPLQIVLDQEVRVQKEGQPIHGKIAQPVYAFDRLVVPVGAEVSGTITKIEWVNPHAWLYVDVKSPDGKVVNWHFELGPPNALFRLGWRKDAIPVGTEVEITGFRAKSMEAVANGRSIILPDGKELFSGGSGPGSEGAGKQ